MKNKTTLKAAAFFFAVLFAMGAGALRNSNNRDFYLFDLDLSTSKNIVKTIDLAEQNLPKHLLQPNSITLSGKLRSGERSKELYAKFEGLPGYLSQGRKKGVWPELKEGDALQIGKRYTPLNIEVHIPRQQTESYHVGAARLIVFDKQQVISTVDFHIINSNKDK